MTDTAVPTPAPTPAEPRVVECPSATTRAWKRERAHGVETYRDPAGTVWVPVIEGEPAEIVVVFTKIPGLPPARYARAENSWRLRGAEKRARRKQRELRRRGYDA